VGRHWYGDRDLAAWRARGWARPLSVCALIAVLLAAAIGAERFAADPVDPVPEALPQATHAPDEAGPDPFVTLTVGPEQPVPRATPRATPSATSRVTTSPSRRPSPPPRRPASTSPKPPPSPDCQVSMVRTSEWDDGYVARVTLRNVDTQVLNGWTMHWVFGGDQRISSLWNGRASQVGREVQVRDDGWNAVLAPGESLQFGFEAIATPADTDPVRFSVNGAGCA
jgi:hypothetical protein